MHSIRTDFGFNLLSSASKLKRGVIEKNWWVLLVFRIREFSFLQYFCCFFCRESWWGHCPWIIFSQIYFTFFMIYASRLRFYEPFFPMWSSVFVLCCFFFLSTRCQYYLNYWTHPPFNCWLRLRFYW
jgi:hypothetical protein